MAGVKISNLPAASTPLAGTELVPVVQGGVTVKVAASNLSGSSTFTATGTGAVTRQISSKLGDLIAPQDFGAVGDGVANDTTAWANWLNATGSKYIPKGNYLVSGVVYKYRNPTFSNGNSETSFALGQSALISSVTPFSSNTAIGSEAGRYLVYGASNVAIGYSALYGAECSFNIAIGENALRNSAGASNTAVGHESSKVVSTGQANSSFGSNSLYSCTTGQNNTAIGTQSLFYCATGSNNTAVGYLALDVGAALSNCTGLGANSDVTGNNQVQLGDSATTTYAYGAVQNRSDARDKTDIKDTVLGLDFIKTLRPVDFRWDYREDYNWGEKDGSKKRSRFHHGLIAQEVAVACSFLNVDFGGLQDHSKTGGKDVLSIGYEELIGPMIKAIQELTAKVESLESKLSNLK